MSKKASQKTQLVNWEDLPSPYRKPSHVRWRKHVRAFIDKEVQPKIDKWEKAMDIPSEFYRKCYKAGLYSHQYPKEYGGTPFEDDSSGERIDPFLSIILYEEIARSGSGGLMGAGWIHYVAVTPVLLFGSEYLKQKMRDGMLGIISQKQSGNIHSNIQ